MEPEQVQEILTAAFPSAEVTVSDMTGTRDHFQVTVFWTGFQGKRLIQQQQLVNQALKIPLEDGRIHALALRTAAL